MTDAATQPKEARKAIDTTQLDLSSIVGRPVVLVCEQFPGKKLQGKVLDSHGLTLSLDRSGPLLDGLISNQKTVILFEYRGQRISAGAVVKRSGGGRCRVTLAERAFPCCLRRYRRVELALPTKLAQLPKVPFDPAGISRWRWFETDTANVSGGGTLLHMSTRLEAGSLLLMHIELKQGLLPPLVLGLVRHCTETETGRYRAGVQFVVSEEYTTIVSDSRRDCLPRTVLDMSQSRRDGLDKHLQAWMRR
jgi:hypothetical protein